MKPTHEKRICHRDCSPWAHGDQNGHSQPWLSCDLAVIILKMPWLSCDLAVTSSSCDWALIIGPGTVTTVVTVSSWWEFFSHGPPCGALFRLLSKWKDVYCGIALTKICYRFSKSFKDHLVKYYISTWQWCEFSKKYSFHNCLLFPYPYISLDIVYCPSNILFVSLFCTFIVNP